MGFVGGEGGIESGLEESFEQLEGLIGGGREEGGLDQGGGLWVQQHGGPGCGDFWGGGVAQGEGEFEAYFR